MNQENEANNLILELSADLEEEEQPSQKKKPTIVQAKRTRFVSRPMSKYEQLREKRIAERKQIIWGSLTCFDLIMTSL